MRKNYHLWIIFAKTARIDNFYLFISKIKRLHIRYLIGTVQTTRLRRPRDQGNHVQRNVENTRFRNLGHTWQDGRKFCWAWVFLIIKTVEGRVVTHRVGYKLGNEVIFFRHFSRNIPPTKTKTKNEVHGDVKHGRPTIKRMKHCIKLISRCLIIKGIIN